jgi:hypothetical protein
LRDCNHDVEELASSQDKPPESSIGCGLRSQSVSDQSDTEARPWECEITVSEQLKRPNRMGD